MKCHLRSLPLIAMITLSGVNATCSMEFAQHYDGAMRMDGNSTWISADGEITAETLSAFERFLNDALIFKRQAFCSGRHEARSVARLRSAAVPRGASVRHVSISLMA